MVKFGSKNDPAYGSALDRLRTFEREAKDVVEKRFCPPAGLTGSHVHFIVPYSRNERFIAGDQNLGRIKEKLAAQKSSHHRRLAIYGLGGVGKTQDVLEYVYTFKDSPVSVFWVHAGSTARFEQDYRKLARAVELPGWDDAKKDIRPIVKEWLESPKSGNWILVLDNADNAANFFSTDESTASDGLASFVPQGAKGTVVVTTRTREVADQLAGMNILSKDVMETDQAEQLFIQHYPATTDHERESILLLLRVLHNLPLAIIHVAAYLRRNPTFSPSKYINLFNSTRDSQMHFLSKPFSDLRRGATAETVLATFSITFRQIQEQSPLSGSLLKLIACIDRQSIPHELLADSGFEGANDEFTLNEAISKLLNFSLLTTVQNGSAYEIHSLVHVSIAAFLTQRQEMDAVQRWTAELFARLLPNGEVHNWPFWRVYFPHASALASKITKDADTLHTAAIYNLMSGYLLAIGRYREAEGLARKSTKVRTHLLGQEHPDTLISMDNLAMTYMGQRRWREAEELQVKVIQTRKRVLGQEHPATLTSMNDLASTYLSQGRLREAEELQVKVIQTRKRVLGQEHPDTLTSMNDLASTYWNQGWLREAEELNVKVMQTRKRVLGQEHPDTLTSMNNLASTYSNQGRLREAEELNVKVMQTRKRVLGQEHPVTLISMNNLATTYMDQKRWREAEELQVKVMQTSKRVLGQEHPATLTSMNDLASTYLNQGRLREAEELNVKVMQTRKRVLGQEHPDTLTSMNNLASTYVDQERWREAEELNVKVMQTRKRVLGQEHPVTLISMNNLASTYWNQGRLREAEELQVKVMQTRKRVLGQEHPDTLISMNDLASTYWNQGRLREAEELNVKVMQTRKRVLGQEHPATLTSMNNLAWTWKSQGRVADAIVMMTEVANLGSSLLGRDHPHTSASMSTLKEWRDGN
ncbi:hypothetical protein FN846DRAFT_301079 [Sphaerosporella brunnea]|uniref:NB-ARC domain-containing protein n=1 Tax=Sphaerosporella brunnea TaxID=1250544 RepID=A0A5J5ELF0_9PEZI|nr:hypothetical protein FN846DRAFT_301079 [Sphaerosporella brunnea]